MKYLEKEKITEILSIMNKKDSQGWPIPDFEKFSKLGEILGIEPGRIIEGFSTPNGIYLEIWGVSGDREKLTIIF